jgi:hypothetical protein
VKCELPVRGLNHGLNGNGNRVGMNLSKNGIGVKSDTTKAVQYWLKFIDYPLEYFHLDRYFNIGFTEATGYVCGNNLRYSTI